MITKEQLIENVFKKYVDPELGIDVWTLGLVYDISINEKKVKVLMTFTSPMCPYGPQMVSELTEMMQKEGAEKADVNITFDPPWKPSEDVLSMLGMVE